MKKKNSKTMIVNLYKKYIKNIFRYSTLTVPEEDAANCLYVNGTLIHIDNAEAAESVKVLHAPILKVFIQSMPKARATYFFTWIYIFDINKKSP